MAWSEQYLSSIAELVVVMARTYMYVHCTYVYSVKTLYNYVNDILYTNQLKIVAYLHSSHQPIHPYCIFIIIRSTLSTIGVIMTKCLYYIYTVQDEINELDSVSFYYGLQF